MTPTIKKETKKEVVSIYIDGFNFYHNAIKNWGRQYYYPSLRALCEIMLDSLNTPYHINEIHYFTANVRSSNSDPQKKRRQRNYINALERDGVKIHRGYFSTRDGRKKEKQTDVNIVVQMLNDAWADKYTHGVLVSNDSDFVGLLRAVRENLRLKVGVWNIIDKTERLAEVADYTQTVRREYIKQLPQIANKGTQPKRKTPHKITARNKFRV